MKHLFATVALVTLFATTARASDHLDTAAVIADPAADIGDLYAWMSPDGRRLNLVMTIVGKRFTDHVRYTFHIDSGPAMEKVTTRSTLSCEFNSAVAPMCWLDDVDHAHGDASGKPVISANSGAFACLPACATTRSSTMSAVRALRSTSPRPP